MTVIDASPNIRIRAPWRESTVCTRLIGAIRLSRPIQPSRVWTAVVGDLPPVDPEADARHQQDVGDRQRPAASSTRRPTQPGTSGITR